MAARRVGTPLPSQAGVPRYPTQQPMTGYPGIPQGVVGTAMPNVVRRDPVVDQPFPATEAFPGSPQPIIGSVEPAAILGVDQNGRSLAFPDAGPNASGAGKRMVTTSAQSGIATSTTTTTTIEQARAAARAKNVKGTK